jgi:hypothetical protein
MDAVMHRHFDRWVVAPLAKLKELPDGDGAFAALSIAFGLYERFIDSQLKKAGLKASPKNFHAAASTDFDGLVTPENFQRFWEMYRVGMQHAYQPKRYWENESKGNRWGWDISDKYERYPQVVQTEKDLFIITLDPFKFVEHVLVRHYEHPELLNELSNFEFGEIHQETVITPGLPQSAS